MGAALAPLDSTRSAGLVIVFSLFIAACCAVCDSHRTNTDHGADVCGVVDGRFARIAFGRGGGDRLFDRRRGWLAVFCGRRRGHFAFLWSNWRLSRCVSGGCVHHRRVCRTRLGQALSNSGGGDGDWFAIIFLGGWAWFAVLTNTPPVAAFKLAVLPFLLGDVIKIALARQCFRRLGVVKR